MKRFNSMKAEQLIVEFVQKYIKNHGNVVYTPTGNVTEVDKVLDPYINYDRFSQGLKDWFFLNFDETPTSCKWWSRNVYKLLKTHGIVFGICHIDMTRKEFTLRINNVEKVIPMFTDMDNCIISFSSDTTSEITKSY